MSLNLISTIRKIANNRHNVFYFALEKFLLNNNHQSKNNKNKYEILKIQSSP